MEKISLYFINDFCDRTRIGIFRFSFLMWQWGCALTVKIIGFGFSLHLYIK